MSEGSSASDHLLLLNLVRSASASYCYCVSPPWGGGHDGPGSVTLVAAKVADCCGPGSVPSSLVPAPSWPAPAPHPPPCIAPSLPAPSSPAPSSRAPSSPAPSLPASLLHVPVLGGTV